LNELLNSLALFLVGEQGESVSKIGYSLTSGEKVKEQLPLEQSKYLLRTKFYAPPIRPSQIARSRLINQINRGLDRALILISAPAGYGKTTLVSSWLKDLHVPSTWLSLDEGDNDPIRFLQNFLAALHKIIPALQPDLISTFQGMKPDPFTALMNFLINEIAVCEAPFVFVIDDFHVIQVQPILDLLTALLENMLSQMHLVLISRIDPPLPLFRLRARDQLVEIRAEQLQFTQEETTVFLNEVMGLRLSDDDVSALEIRTEGWIAGLQLASIALQATVSQSHLSMQGSKDIHSFISEFTGSHYYIMDYLTEEVLKLQSESLSLFLMQTSILSSMCGPLCEAVVDKKEGEPIKGQAMLEDLEQKNLFVVPLDDKRQWYRYHHLFADMLSRHLENRIPRQAPELHRRASQWYEQNGFIPEGIQHALIAGERDRAIQLIEQNGVQLLIHGEVTTLLRWIETVEPYSQTHPWFYIFKAWAYALTGDLDRVEGMLRIAEELISSMETPQEVRIMQGTIAAARAHRANLQGQARIAADFARQALEYLPDIDLVSRSLRTVATSLLGDASSMSGDLEEAKRAYIESARIGKAAGDIHLTIVVNSNLSNILIEQGLLHQAARVYSESLSMATRPDGQKTLIAGRVFVELSQVFYEWNRLEEAFMYAQQGMALCQQWGNMDLQAVGYVMLARLQHLRSHLEEAQGAMQAAEQLANAYDLAPRNSVWVKSALARLSIYQGNLEKASHFIQATGVTMTGFTGDVEITYLHEPIFLVYMRLLLAHGEYDTALALCKSLLQNAQAAKRIGRTIEVLALQALAFQGKKDLDQALEVLERAILLAQPERYIRTFLDEGEPMAKLLYKARSHRMGTAYAGELLSAMGNSFGRALPPAEVLIEPLTLRELEVLKFIEAGYSNQEIAAELVISMPTVKRHISNIYTKLGTSSRTQAVSRGRELNLFR
jgi:LuxR family maltose regulon positive regulatory protein